MVWFSEGVPEPGCTTVGAPPLDSLEVYQEQVVQLAIVQQLEHLRFDLLAVYQEPVGQL